MNEEHQKAMLSVLEHQRNSALNGLVNVEAALTVALAENKVLKGRINQLTQENHERSNAAVPDPAAA